jgi:outer membrane protein assembly factor BamB
MVWCALLGATPGRPFRRVQFMTKFVELRKVTCPSCGAPVELEGNRGKCDYCGALLERDEPTPAQPEPEIHWTGGQVIGAPVMAGPVIISEPPVAAGGGFAGCIIAFVVLMLIGGGVVAYLAFSGVSSITETFESAFEGDPFATAIADIDPGITSSPYHVSSGEMLVLPAGDGGAAELLLPIWDQPNSTYPYAFINGDQTLRWVGPPMESGSLNYLGVGPNHVLIARETALQGLDRGDGTQLWQATLSDQVSNICMNCIQVVENRAFVLSQEGNLQAFDVATGGLLWSHLFTEQPRQLVVVGGRPGAFDQGEDEEISLFLFDPATGVAAQTLAPRCRNESFPDSPQGAYIWSPVLQDQAQTALYFFGGFFEPGCIQRWDSVTGAMVWQAEIPTRLLRFDEPPLLTDSALFVAEGGLLVGVDTATGAVTELVNIEDYDLWPLALQAKTLLVRATRTRGTSRDELWALDAVTGERRWEFVPQADELTESMGVVHDTDEGVWSWGVTPQGVAMLQARPDKRLVVELLNLQDGASQGQSSIPLDPDATYWYHVVDFHDNKFWVVVDDELLVVDPATAAITAQWP